MGVFANSNDYLDGRKPVPTTESAHEVLCVDFTIELGTGDLDLNDIGAVGILPAGHVPVDVHVFADDLDSSTAALVLDVGVLDDAGTGISTDAADGGGKWGSTTAVNTAFHQRLTPYLANMANVTAEDTDREIAVKIATAPTTAVAGTLGLRLFYRPE